MMTIISKNNNNGDVRNGNECSLKKGPWTLEEDAKLTDYVSNYGEGDWNSVQKNSGLLRCGKSCRLRWVNHLRPNLKKCAFSLKEESIIVELHAKFGNRWAKMASMLPGRTDNEIKNFWNTRIKRREKAGLPIYPPEIVRDATLYHLHEKQYFEQTYNSPHSSSSPFSSLLSSSRYPKKFNNTNNYSSVVYPPPNQPTSLYGSSSTLFNNQGFMVANNSSESASRGYQYYGGSYNYNNRFSASSMFPPLVPSLVSSSQIPSDSVTPALSYVTAGFDGLMGASRMVSNEYHEVAPFSHQGNSEDSAVATAGKSSSKRKSTVSDENSKEGGTSVAVVSPLKKKTGESSKETPFMTSSGKKEIVRDPFEEVSAWDDDLFSLLNNFSVEMPMPEWYRKGNQSESQGVEIRQPNALPPDPARH